MAIVQTMPIDSAEDGVLEILEDDRLTPELRRSALDLDPDTMTDKRLAALFSRKPAVTARLRQVAESGRTIAERDLGYPLATLAPSSLHGLPDAAFFLTVDATAPIGSYSGPATEILSPARSGLGAETFVAANGERRTLILADTGKAAWKIVRSRIDGTEEIEQISSAPAPGLDHFLTTYTTYRFLDGRWHATARREPGLWESDGPFPPRTRFP